MKPRSIRSCDPSHKPAMRILQTEHLAEIPAQWLAARHDLVRGPIDDPDIRTQLDAFDALVIRTYTTINDELLDLCPQVKVVGRAGVGLDQVDLEACRARGVRVVHTPEANTQAVIEYVMTLTCDAMRPRSALRTPLDTTQWNALRAETIGIRQIADCTVGILGLGRIGSRVARAFTALGARVIYHDLKDIPESARHGATAVSHESLMRESDILTIHVDGRADNHHLLDATALNLLKDDVILLNTARGFVIDENALVACMKQRPAAQALLDVHEQEPIPANAPTWSCPNIHLFPHLAARTEQAMLNMSWVVRDVDAVLRGEEPQFAAC